MTVKETPDCDLIEYVIHFEERKRAQTTKQINPQKKNKNTIAVQKYPTGSQQLVYTSFERKRIA